MSNCKRLFYSSLICLIMTVFFSTSLALGAEPTLVVTPDKTVLSPALLKQPIVITGSGWKPGEMVVVEMILPEGVTVKGINPGDPVGIANGKIDDQGNLKTIVEPLTILMSFFQVDWDQAQMKPDFTKAKPLPPGTYTLEAIGVESEGKPRAALTLLPPPEKK